MTDALTNLESSVRHGYAQVGDVRLHYAEAGSGERLVILLHGFPECWYSRRHQLTALGERFRAVAPDMRGYNLSDKPSRVEDYRVSRLVDDVTGLIRHLGAREAAVVGHDWGAAVAWAVAQHYPDYVWKLAALLRGGFRRRGFTKQERVRVPTLFVYGERDFAIVPETVRGVADYVDAPYTEVRLARANHWVQQEHPSEVNAALLSFLEE